VASASASVASWSGGGGDPVAVQPSHGGGGAGEAPAAVEVRQARLRVRHDPAQAGGLGGEECVGGPACGLLGFQPGDGLGRLGRQVLPGGGEGLPGAVLQVGDAAGRVLQARRFLRLLGHGEGQGAAGAAEGRGGVPDLLVEERQGVLVGHRLRGFGRPAAHQGH
jgi:hypothetical protein